MELLDDRHKLDQINVFQFASQEPGAYVLLDGEGKVLFAAWAADLSQSLTKHLPQNERNAKLQGKVKSFCTFSCDTQELFPSFFDKLCEKAGSVPSVQECIPEGSRYFGNADKPASEQNIEALLAKARAEFDAQNIYSAVTLLENAIEQGDGKPEFHVLFGQLLAVKGFQSAISHFERAAELAPTSPAGIKAMALAERCYDLLVGFRKF